MSPIEGLSDIIRLPRLGKIRLGIKIEKMGKTPYPQATDYFVCPSEVQDIFGEKPKELEIMFPIEDSDLFAQQWLRCYSLSQGLVCIGNGVAARRKIDLSTGGIAGRATKDWTWKEELRCDPQECPEYTSKRCRRVMNLQFLMPKVEGIGVWQIDTTSFYSIVNINSMIKLIKSLCGRIGFIPLTLCLGPVEVTPPGMTKKTVHVMHIKQKVKLVTLLQAAQKEPAMVLLPEPATEEPPEDLFPVDVLDKEEPIMEVLDEEEPMPEADNSIAVWNEIRTLVQELKPTAKRVQDWWKQAYDLDVTLKDFSYVKPPEKFGQGMLEMFRNKLKQQERPQLPLEGA